MSNNQKIMLIEDDPLFVHLYETVFKSAGYEIETAFNGWDGLNKLTSAIKKPTIILSDVMMPQMNGLELLQKIKESPDLKNIPVVLLTNLGKEDDIKRGIEL
ncbi:MAG: response regulator, partial [Patescibacteria group bacterium]